MLSLTAGGALARPFHTHCNALSTPLFLRIAPELYLKVLIVPLDLWAKATLLTDCHTVPPCSNSSLAASTVCLKLAKCFATKVRANSRQL